MKTGFFSFSLHFFHSLDSQLYSYVTMVILYFVALHDNLNAVGFTKKKDISANVWLIKMTAGFSIKPLWPSEVRFPVTIILV